jgi:hypothetical protein
MSPGMRRRRRDAAGALLTVCVWPFAVVVEMGAIHIIITARRRLLLFQVKGSGSKALDRQSSEANTGVLQYCRDCFSESSK